MAGAGAVIGVLSAVISAGAAIHQGRQEKKAADRQADALEAQAKVAIKQSERDAEIKRREVARINARASSKFAGEGLKFAGSVLNVLSQTREEGELDVLTILERGQDEARGIMSQARISRRGGEAAWTTGLLSGGANLTAGIADTGSKANWWKGGNKSSSPSIPSGRWSPRG